MTLDIKDQACMDTSKLLYEDLKKLGLDIFWDDRDQRAGFKFKDADS